MPDRVGLQRTRLPDYSIGATVLMVAIALPFFIFTRAQHVQRVSARTSASATPATSVQTITPPDPTASSPPASGPAPSQSAAALPLTADAPTRPGRLLVFPRPTPRASSSAPAPPASTPQPTPAPPPDFPPVVLMALSTTDGPAPLPVTVDASGSSDTDQTPIWQIVVDFGDGSKQQLDSGRTAEHLYSAPGTYLLMVVVIDTARNSSSATAWITVS